MLAILLTLSFAAVATVRHVDEQLRVDERHNLFAAIESGPLQLARLHSSAQSESHLSKLLENARTRSSQILGASITSGPAQEDTYAAWAHHELFKAERVTNETRTYHFPDSLYPYAVTLVSDANATYAELSVLQQRIWATILISSIAAGFVVIWCLWPIADSIRRASAVLELEERSEDALASVSFLPLRQLASAAMAAREVARAQAIARAMQMIAHDIRRPFSTLKAGLTVLRSSQSKQDFERVSTSLVSSLDGALRRVNGMLKDVIDAGRPFELDRTATSLDDHVRSVVEEALKLNPRARLDVSFALESGAVVPMDAARMERVGLNIVENAIQAMQGTGSLWAGTTTIDKGGRPHVRVTYGNSNSRIDPADCQRIFEPFFTKNKRGGTGLGLALSRQIVRAHGGDIECRSLAENGVEFVIEIPIPDAPLQEITPSKETVHAM